jgi:hypothetical protein
MVDESTSGCGADFDTHAYRGRAYAAAAVLTALL